MRQQAVTETIDPLERLGVGRPLPDPCSVALEHKGLVGESCGVLSEPDPEIRRIGGQLDRVLENQIAVLLGDANLRGRQRKWMCLCHRAPVRAFGMFQLEFAVGAVWKGQWPSPSPLAKNCKVALKHALRVE